MTGRAGPAALVGAVVLVACGEAPEVRDPSTPERSGPSPLGIAAPLDPTAEAGASGSSTPAAVRSAATAVVAPSPSSSGASAAPRTRPSPSAAGVPVFRWSVSGPLRRADVPYSWRPGCPVPPSGLRRLTVRYWGFDGRVRTGALVVSAGSVPAVRSMMAAAFAARFRFRSVVPVDAFYRGGRVSPERSDLLSMAADNTSAFNCRPKTGRSSYSEHSWGAAIDINPYENPARSGSRIYPAGAAARYFVARRAHLRDPGVITTSSAVYRAALRAGWSWGGRWRTSTDYQHFSRSGR